MLWRIETKNDEYIQLILERPGKIDVDMGDTAGEFTGYSICLTIDEAKELLDSLAECIDKAENEIDEGEM